VKMKRLRSSMLSPLLARRSGPALFPAARIERALLALLAIAGLLRDREYGLPTPTLQW
jgi:hypothetical protein